jgi:hypothetical protein
LHAPWLRQQRRRFSKGTRFFSFEAGAHRIAARSMEAMMAADELGVGQEEVDDAPGPLPGEEEDEELDAEAMEAKYQQAMELNMQLKAMMMQAEEQQRLAMQRRSQQRGGGGGQRAMVDTRRHEGGAMFRGQAPAAHGPRPVGMPKNGGWGGQTHTDSRAREINRDNQILVQKLSNIAIARNKPSAAPQQARPFRIAPNKTTVAINQRRKDDQIARENAAMARRLNSVKPTAALSSKAAAQHSAKHNNYLKVLGQPGASRASAVSRGPRIGSAAQSRGALPALNVHRPFE